MSLLSGQPWIESCIRCNQPLHAWPTCAKRVEVSTETDSNEFVCFRCNMRSSCSAPSIPVSLKPGTLEHATHKNCTSEFLRAHVRHRFPKLALTGLKKGQLYNKLFGVQYPKEAEQSARANSRRHQRETATDAQRERRREERWNDYVATHWDPLFRIAMKNSQAFPNDRKKDEWSKESKQQKQTLVHSHSHTLTLTLSHIYTHTHIQANNMVTAGFPGNYVDVLMYDVDFPTTFDVIKNRLSKHSCDICHCHLMQVIPDFEPPGIRGILKKTQVVEEVSFASLKVPTYMDVEVPDPRPLTGIVKLALADGRELVVSIPADCTDYFHVKIPKRPNPYLAPVLTPTLVGKSGSSYIDMHEDT